jgi:heme/copper-type cytochrome/quinol oxidase subunit 2
MHAVDRLSLRRIRERLPLPIFVLVLILLVVMLGFVCLCMTDHPTQAAERAISAIGHVPAIIEMWSVVVVLLLVAFTAPVVEVIAGVGRASPAHLQRFRF